MPKIKNPSILLVFLPDDMPLYESILAEAKHHRQEPDQYILWILEKGLK